MQMREGGCTQPGLYAVLYPHRNHGEARALTLAAYSENDLPENSLEDVRSHLQSCPACAKQLAEFEGTEIPDIARALCPSSEMLDRYLFAPQNLPAQHARSIEGHLALCPLCREESAWWKDLEKAELPFVPRRSLLQPALAVAAVLFFALSAFLFWQGRTPAAPDPALRALAVIKEPSQIDFAELELTSRALSPDLQQQYEQAVSHFRSGRYEAASGALEQVLATTPDHSGAVFLLGYSYYKMDQPERAFALCDRAEGMEPHAYERCMFLVHIALKTGNFDRALLEITALHHEAPNDAGVRDMYQRITALMPQKL